MVWEISLESRISKSQGGDSGENFPHWHGLVSEGYGYNLSGTQ